MNISHWGLLTILLSSQLTLSAQRLKKADRLIVSNFQSHVNNLSGGGAEVNKGGSGSINKASEYIAKQFAKSGLKPFGDTNTFYQKFIINDGISVLPSTYLTINKQKLKLFEDYFPLTISANDKTEAAVAIALAENGVPWFKDLKELLHRDDDSSALDTLQHIKMKASLAAEKGARALIIYNSGEETDLNFDKFSTSPGVAIPVIYLKSNAFKKHCSDESEIIDISLNVQMQAKSHLGVNVVGYADNHADSTVVAGAPIRSESGVAALLEVARLIKGTKGKKKNYLFIAYSDDGTGKFGSDYYEKHPSIDLSKVNYKIDLDTVSVVQKTPKGLHLVKESVETIRKY